jgi:hypothetical protein
VAKRAAFTTIKSPNASRTHVGDARSPTPPEHRCREEREEQHGATPRLLAELERRQSLEHVQRDEKRPERDDDAADQGRAERPSQRARGERIERVELGGPLGYIAVVGDQQVPDRIPARGRRDERVAERPEGCGGAERIVRAGVGAEGEDGHDACCPAQARDTPHANVASLSPRFAAASRAARPTLAPTAAGFTGGPY